MGEMDKPEHIKILSDWMKSYRPEELFDRSGRLRAELAELAPKGDARMSANPHGQRRARAARSCVCPTSAIMP